MQTALIASISWEIGITNMGADRYVYDSSGWTVEYLIDELYRHLVSFYIEMLEQNQPSSTGRSVKVKKLSSINEDPGFAS